jgi:hypothetical protein
VVPSVGGVLGGFLAQATLWLDGVVRLPPDWTYSASTASGVLTAIAGAMVALLGFVVTIGVLEVRQATGTLSPRYMRLWYRDRLQKASTAAPTVYARSRWPRSSGRRAWMCSRTGPRRFAPAPPMKATWPPLLRAAVRCGTFRLSAAGRCSP